MKMLSKSISDRVIPDEDGESMKIDDEQKGMESSPAKKFLDYQDLQFRTNNL